MAVLHTSFVKATNPGGRLFDGIDQNVVRKNGEVGFLGGYAGATEGVLDGQTQVKKFEVPANVTQGQANHGRMPVIIMQPEMMYDNSRKSLLQLSLMEIEAKKPFVCVPLQEGDKFDISADGLELRGQDAGTSLAVGKCYELANASTKITLTTNGNGNAPTVAGTVYFEIVKVKDAHARSARIGGALAKDNYKLYTLEVKVKRA